MFYFVAQLNKQTTRQMKTSILKASKEAAEALSANCLIKTTKKGTPIFQRVEIKDGFELIAPTKENGEWKRDENKKLIRETVFKFTNSPAPKIEWNEDYITI